ncbi:MAG: 3D domain-containing protein [bacterium]
MPTKQRHSLIYYFLIFIMSVTSLFSFGTKQVNQSLPKMEEKQMINLFEILYKRSNKKMLEVETKLMSRHKEPDKSRVVVVNSDYYTITAYCQGSTNAAGNTPTVGTIAAPRDLPLGSKVRINGKIYIVEDRTNIRYDKGLRNSESRFDIYMGDGEFDKCYQFGKQLLKVEILK